MIGTPLHPDRVHLFWAVLATVVVLVWLELRRRDALGRFMSAIMQRRLARRPTRGQRLASLALVAACLASGVVALMRPQTIGALPLVQTSPAVADILIVLDVSKSMLAEDAAPNRLKRAKADVATILGRLQGHRVGLVAFAGRAELVVPLTADYDFFRLKLRDVDPQSVGRGGTQIGTALRAALGAFAGGAAAKLMFLITDGEDHDSYATEMAHRVAEAGVRVVAVGFGSEQGSAITITDPQTGARRQLMDESGKPVISRLDGDLLRKIAAITDGVYVPAGVAALDLESILATHIEPMVREQSEKVLRLMPEDRYPWFVLAALVALLAAVWVSSRRARSAPW